MANNLERLSVTKWDHRRRIGDANPAVLQEDGTGEFQVVREAAAHWTVLEAVVGPNGSGKSNVIDEMVFVFGKRAQEMRLKKESELIHDTHQNPDRASVFDHFNDIIDLDAGATEASIRDVSISHRRFFRV